MKIKINGIDIECTPSECAEFIKAMGGTTTPSNTQEFPSGLSPGNIIEVTRSSKSWFTVGKYYQVKSDLGNEMYIVDDDGDSWYEWFLTNSSDVFGYKIIL